jgi:peptidoglycan-associated lipoprotein
LKNIMNRKIPSLYSAIIMLMATTLLAACSESSRSVFSSDITPGVTDEPAAGFKSIKTGSEEDFIMKVGRRIYFKSGSTEFDDVALETMNIQAEWLKANPSWLMKMQGHANDPGGKAKNIQLSEKRAKAVMKYFVSRGLSPQRMWVSGYGKERFVRDCAQNECQVLNRRVVVNLRKKFDGAAPQFKSSSG